MSTTRRAMGLDIGGSGIKGAIVDVAAGELVSKRVRIATPQPATPEAVIDTVVEIRRQLSWAGAIGCGFPGLTQQGVVRGAPNLDPSWIGYHLMRGLRQSLGEQAIAVLNDADAAGLAEVQHGAGRDVRGTVVVLTLGTGIGTALFRDGVLLPDTELGHVQLEGEDAELLASESARHRRGWSWKKWAGYVDRYLAHLEYLLAVDLFIIGGGAIKKADKFLPRLERVGCAVVPARLGNLAGMIGAAMRAAQSLEPGDTAATGA